MFVVSLQKQKFYDHFCTIYFDAIIHGAVIQDIEDGRQTMLFLPCGFGSQAHGLPVPGALLALAGGV